MADTVLLEGFGFEPPRVVPAHGELMRRQRASARPRACTVPWWGSSATGRTCSPVTPLSSPTSVTHSLTGVSTLWPSTRIRSDQGRTTAGSTTPAVDMLRAAGVDAVVTTTLAAGSLDEQSESWDPGSLAALDVPVIQAICATTPRSAWEASKMGLSPVDVAMAVAIPEFDGRVITVPISFKETVDAGDELVGAALTAYRTIPDRVDRVAELARQTGDARLCAGVRAQDRSGALCVPDEAEPARQRRRARHTCVCGLSVGSDCEPPAIGSTGSLIRETSSCRSWPTPSATTARRLSVTSREARSAGSRRRPTAPGSPGCPTGCVCRWSSTGVLLPGPCRQPQGRRETRGRISSSRAWTSAVFSYASSHLAGSVRTLSPSTTRPTCRPLITISASTAGWTRCGARMAIVHVGKHGNLEWLPGKGVGLSAECGPDAALGSMPLVYPFVVNDPGEGAQAKRRAHAVIVDHLVPPLTRADTYDDLATLEGLLDEHARVSSLDPAKLPAIRRQVWDCLVAAEIHRDMGLDAGAAIGREFEDPAFDDLLVEVDGYLCELKDAQIRGGLHILGCAPEAEAELDMVLAITRSTRGRCRRFARPWRACSVSRSNRAVHPGIGRCSRASRKSAGGSSAACQSDGWSVRSARAHRRCR